MNRRQLLTAALAAGALAWGRVMGVEPDAKLKAEDYEGRWQLSWVDQYGTHHQLFQPDDAAVLWDHDSGKVIGHVDRVVRVDRGFEVHLRPA